LSTSHLTKVVSHSPLFSNESIFLLTLWDFLWTLHVQTLKFETKLSNCLWFDSMWIFMPLSNLKARVATKEQGKTNKHEGLDVKTTKHNNLCLFCSVKRCYGLAHPTKTYLWNDTHQWNCKEICTTNFESKEPYEICSQSLKPSSSTQTVVTISTNNNDKLPFKSRVSNTYISIPSFIRSNMNLDATNHHNSSQVTWKTWKSSKHTKTQLTTSKINCCNDVSS